MNKSQHNVSFANDDRKVSIPSSMCLLQAPSHNLDKSATLPPQKQADKLTFTQ